MESPKLDVMIVTMAHRMDHLLSPGSLPAVPGVRYIIACQDPDSILADDLLPPPFRERDDVRFAIFRDRGVTRNRNHALDMSSAPYLYVADDDLDFRPEGFRAIIEAFERNPDLDCALFMADLPDKRRLYPPRATDLPRPWPHHSPLNIEIALRKASTKDCGVRFCELSGIGAPRLGAGEEEFLMASLRKRKKRIRFFPVSVVSHPGETTSGRNRLKSDVIRAKGACIGTIWSPGEMLLHIPVEAWRSPANFFRAAWLLVDGYLYYLRHIRQTL